MIIHSIKCEVCDNTHKIDHLSRPYEWNLPDSWIILTEGNSQIHDGCSFCSRDCLAAWLGMTTVPTNAAQSKMRRFLLVDGETADEFEGVKWSNGAVSVNVGDGGPATLRFNDWEQLKVMNPGSGVTWIDQEVSDE